MERSRRLTRLLPPVAWMALIAVGSSSLLGADRTSPWTLRVLGALWPGAGSDTLAWLHVGLRKLGHITEYGILAVLWRRALAPAADAPRRAFLLAAAYGVLDELRQGLTPNREPSVLDVLVDAAGAWLGLVIWEGADARAIGTLRVAAWGLGGLALVAGGLTALDLALGRPAADAALAAASLGLAAVGLGRLARATALRVSSEPRPPPAP